MSTRAEKVYLSFYEGDLANGPRLACAIRQAIQEASVDVDSTSNYEFVNELYELCDELEDPTLLDGIYEGCYD